MRQREDGRTEIEGVTLLLEHVELAADLRVFLVDGDSITFLRQRDGRGQSAQAGPDDDDVFLALISGAYFPGHDAREPGLGDVIRRVFGERLAEILRRLRPLAEHFIESGR